MKKEEECTGNTKGGTWAGSTKTGIWQEKYYASQEYTSGIKEKRCFPVGIGKEYELEEVGLRITKKDVRGVIN